MTCIVGVRTKKGDVWLGADSAISSYSGHLQLATSKIVALANNTILVGVAGDPRLLQVLQYHLTVEAFKGKVRSAGAAEEYLVTKFIPALKTALNDTQFSVTENQRQEMVSNAMLIGFGGYLWTVWQTFALIRLQEPFDAIGSGELYARSVLFDRWNEKGEASPEETVRRALSAAAHFDLFTKGPLTVKKL